MPRKVQGRRDRGTYRHRGKDRDGRDIWLLRVTVASGIDPKTGKYRQKQVAKTVHGPEREAKKELTKMLREMDTGNFVDPSEEAFGDFMERWLAQIKAEIRPTTWDGYACIARKHIIPALGRQPLQKITPSQLQDLYAAKLGEGLSTRTVRLVHAVIHMAFARAVKLQLALRNVAEAATPPALRQKEMKTWGAEEVKKFLEAARGSRYYAAFALAIFAGLRRGEVLALRWEDVDLDAGTVLVRRNLVRSTSGGGLVVHEPKTARGRRVVAIPPVAVQALREHRKAQEEEKLASREFWQDTGLVFCSQVGTAVDPQHLSRRCFLPLVKKAGVPTIRLHDLRHTSATLLLAQGENPRVVSERLGHANVGFTLQTYTHVLPGYQEEAAKKLQEAVFPTGQG